MISHHSCIFQHDISEKSLILVSAGRMRCHKVLSMARELTQWAAHLKRDPETSLCMAHMPDLYLDVHNGCVMYKMRTYISLVEGLRQRRCAYTREVRKLGVTLRQLFIIMSEKCHGDLVFTIFDCAALER
ncbi:cytokine-like protein 1 isoform X2 [Trachinotus anak]|uniref:cytokine-like protein 1 isoform X2 n=1 Tax=Trachinotus anak TaxID=443729 RepID=UPI0039F17CAB